MSFLSVAVGRSEWWEAIHQANNMASLNLLQMINHDNSSVLTENTRQFYLSTYESTYLEVSKLSTIMKKSD